MFKAERKDGKIKQLRIDGTIEEDSNLQENAGIEDWSVENESTPDSDGIVIPETSGNGEVKKGVFLAKKNFKMETTKAVLTYIAEAPTIDKITPLPADPVALINARKINEIIDAQNDFTDFVKEELDKM